MAQRQMQDILSATFDSEPGKKHAYETSQMSNGLQGTSKRPIANQVASATRLRYPSRMQCIGIITKMENEDRTLLQKVSEMIDERYDDELLCRNGFAFRLKSNTSGLSLTSAAASEIIHREIRLAGIAESRSKTSHSPCSPCRRLDERFANTRTVDVPAVTSLSVTRMCQKPTRQQVAEARTLLESRLERSMRPGNTEQRATRELLTSRSPITLERESLTTLADYVKNSCLCKEDLQNIISTASIVYATFSDPYVHTYPL